MGSLLDTDVISQRTKPRPDARVVGWLERIDHTQTFLSVVSKLELRTGIELMPPGRRRENLNRWLEVDLALAFSGRILPVTDSIAEEAGRMLASTRKSGAAVHIADALIAATANVHGLTLATLNRRHFERLDVELVPF